MPGALRNFSRLSERQGRAIFRASDFGVMRNTPIGTQRAELQTETETAWRGTIPIVELFLPVTNTARHLKKIWRDFWSVSGLANAGGNGYAAARPRQAVVCFPLSMHRDSPSPLLPIRIVSRAG